MTALLALLLLATPQANTEAGIEVTIVKPATLQAVFGTVDVEASVHADRKIVGVELFVDDHSAGTLDKPPYRWRVNVGQDNKEHRFRVVATGELGTTGTSTVVTPRIRVLVSRR